MKHSANFAAWRCQTGSKQDRNFYLQVRIEEKNQFYENIVRFIRTWKDDLVSVDHIVSINKYPDENKKFLISVSCSDGNSYVLIPQITQQEAAKCIDVYCEQLNKESK